MRFADDALRALRVPRRELPATELPRSVSRARLADTFGAALSAHAAAAERGDPRPDVGGRFRGRRLAQLAEALASGELAALEDPEAHGEVVQFLTGGVASRLWVDAPAFWARQSTQFALRATIALSRARLASSISPWVPVEPWAVVRAVLSRAPADEWVACRVLADDARGGAGAELAAAIGFAFPEVPAWSEAAARTWLTGDDAFSPILYALVSSVGDAALVASILEADDPSVSQLHVGPFAADAIVVGRDAAVAPLLGMLAAIERGRKPTGQAAVSLLAVADALACVGDAKVQDVLARVAARRPPFAAAARASAQRFGARQGTGGGQGAVGAMHAPPRKRQ